MSISYYHGHLNGNYALIPTNAKFYVWRTNETSPPEYSMGTSLKDFKCVKDLGIMVSSDLSWSEHVNVTVNKANKLLGLVHRAVGSSNPGAFSTLQYKSLMRPVLEYAAPAWNLYLAKDVLALERVQRGASRLTLGQKRAEMEYEDRLRKLKWPTLETRRLCLSLVECYKIVFGMNKLNQPALTIRINYMLSQQSVIHINILFLAESYGTGIVLPGSIVEAGSLSRFKSALRRYLNIY